MGNLTETWQIHNNINIYLLEAIDEAYLADTSLSKGRNVGEQFAHIHNVRLMWLKAAVPHLMENLNKVEKDDITKAGLIIDLKASGAAINNLLEQAESGDGKIKGFKPHATAFLGYLISHESHHRGQVMLCLKQSGHPADKKIQYGIWEWGTR